MTTPSPFRVRSARANGQDGFTLIELLVVVAMIGILATIAFPILLRARISSNEGVAVASLRTIHTAEAAFASTCGSGGYAQTLADLAKVPPTSTVGFIQDPYVVNGVVMNGYEANVMAGSGASVILPSSETCNDADEDAMTSFVAERHAVSIGVTGVRSFAVDTQGQMYMREDGLPIDSAVTGATPFH